MIAVRGGEIRLIEVKSRTADSPFAGFGPDKRAALLEAAEIAGGSAWLVSWPPRKSPRWIGSDDWPRSSD